MSNRRIAVLHVAVPAAVGGLERVLHGLAVGQHTAGHRVRVLAVVGPGDEAHAFVDALSATGVSVEALRIPARAYLRERQRVAELLRAEPTDVLHTHGFRPDVLDSGVGRRAGVATVTTEHGMSKMGGRTALYEWLQTRALRRFDAVVAVSGRIAEQLPSVGVDPARVHLIPNAWDGVVNFLSRAEARQALDLAPEAFVIGWIGRLIGAKGADVLLDAIARIPDLGPVIVIGDGPERRSLEARTRALGLTASVRFIGMRHDAGRLIRAFDVFPLSSRTEGTPIVLLEAMAAGVPVVATKVGGVPDVVGAPEAVLVAPEDPAGLADAIQSVRRDPAAAARRADAAATRLERQFARAPWLQRYEEVYRTVLRSPSRR